MTCLTRCRAPFQRYQKSAEDNFAGNYFKPKRATELLIQSHGESDRPFNKWKGTG